MGEKVMLLRLGLSSNNKCHFVYNIESWIIDMLEINMMHPKYPLGLKN
jgi:hypothetical protein